MRPVLTDRMAVIGIVAGLLVWLGCLTILWGWAWHPTGTTSLRVLLSTCLVCWMLLRMRGGLGRLGLRAIRRLHLGRRVPLEDALADRIGSTKQDAHKRLQLLTAASLLAVACFSFSTAWVPVALGVSLVLGEYFLFSSFVWTVLEWLSLLLGALPIGLGLVVVLLATKEVRAGSGRDVYASAYRDWLWALSLGLLGIAVAWWFGTNLVYLAFTIGAGICVVSLTDVWRGELSTHPRRALLPFGQPERTARLKVAIVHACLALALIVQVRLLGDLFALSLIRRLLWAFLTVALLAYFLGRVDRKSRPPGRLQVSGAALGVMAALLIQSAEWLLLSTMASPADYPWYTRGWAYAAWVLPVATQIPMSCLAATALSYQRRNYAMAGLPVGGYVAGAIGGVGVGLLAFGLLTWLPAGGYLVALLAAAGVLAAGWDGRRHALQPGHRPAWIAWAIVLLVGFGGALVASLVVARQTYGPVDVGAWLTVRSQTDADGRTFDRHGLLPTERTPRSPVITECLQRVLELRHGKWWIVATDLADMPEEIPAGVYAEGAAPQPPAAPFRAKRRNPPLSFTHADYYAQARLNYAVAVGKDTYDGILLAPLPLDHPQAWRVYNETMLYRCLQMVRTDPGTDQVKGLMVLRTQAHDGQIRRLLSVALTFYRQVRSGWAVVAFSTKGVDVLLLGPDDALAEEAIAYLTEVTPELSDVDNTNVALDEKQYEERQRVVSDDVVAALEELTEGATDVFLVPMEELWRPYTGVEPLWLCNPPGERLADTPQLEGLRRTLGDARELMVLKRAVQGK